MIKYFKDLLATLKSIQADLKEIRNILESVHNSGSSRKLPAINVSTERYP